jgi:gluconolactonase
VKPDQTPVPAADDGADSAVSALDGDAGAPSIPAVYPPLEASQLGVPEAVVKGFSLAEGALWEHCTGTLLFTDVDVAKVHRLTPPNMVELLHGDSNYANGLAFDPSGALWRAEMGGGPEGSRVAKVDSAGVRLVSIEKTASGATFHNPDDLVFRSDGTLYFTDPTFEHGPHGEDSLFNRPIYRVTPEAEGLQVIKEAEFPGPNGIELSPDEKTLYISSYHNDELASYAVAPDGSLSNRKSLRRGLNHADSLCVDVAGNLYVGVDQGLRVLRPDGSVVGTIAVASADGVTNCEFGGDDGKTLYITAWTTIWKISGLPYAGAQWRRNQSLPCP